MNFYIAIFSRDEIFADCVWEKCPYTIPFSGKPTKENMCYCGQKTEEGVSKYIQHFLGEMK